MFYNKFISKSSLITRIPIYAKQSLLKRRFQILSPINQKYDTFENSVISKEKPIVGITAKMNSFKKTYWIDDLINRVKAKSTIPLGNSNDNTGKIPKRELKARKMTDSYIKEILPFKSDTELLEEYVNLYGSIRIGKIFENLDVLAVQIAYKHCTIEKEQYSDLTIVTASLDRLDLIKPLSISDIRLSGHITYVGYSSMEEALKDEISTDDHIKGDTLMMARVIMVAKDLFTGRSVQQKFRRLKSAATALSKLPPTEEEKLIIHDCYLEYCKYAEKTPENIKWIDETIMESATLMQPQKRNIHGFVFGGYLMKLAFELAFSNASVFLKSRLKFLALDEISFRKPVQIGSILIMTSQIVYASGSPHYSFQVAVTADVLDIEQETRDMTNIFHFTFSSDNSVRKIMPKTYHESIKLIEGRRRRQVGLKSKDLIVQNLELPINFPKSQ
ncbi:1658_t:CDS:10 [Funneliformis geosporum]|uniref:1658_t:CDS:1 n=1 Tax=Funneliformis geosporum TaxID=1117311 RepID=A0A9W4SLF9_9GLOM|nr:1658_t:CDS:10 [Funneliformis geosporum]